ncbi:MAG: ATP-binding cassette domain-containing protein [Phycisphaerales bacterium]|nr:ATP-binding cassette domain-containing protein [Phycisphaerales bacterium]
MIEVRNLTKRYGPIPAVDDVSFSVETASTGNIIGFLGPNGAGKSTTIRILTCYLPATSGSASVAGYDVFTQSLHVRRNIGYLPESAPLYPEMRAREYLNFRGKLHGMTRHDRESAIRRVTERCWLGEFIDRPIGQLSKGMRQRVGLADALLHDPKVLFLDEPTIGLDPTQIRETRQLIRDLGQRHVIFLSSHILPEVEATCTHTIVIANGRVLASGSPTELRDRIGAGSRLIAEIKGKSDEVRGAISGIAEVSRVEIEPVGPWNRLTIEANGSGDVREEVFRVTAARGWTLREMRREVASLEDFFIKITAEQRAARAK